MENGLIWAAAIAVAVTLGGGSAVRAADVRIPGKISIIKDGKLAKLVAKPTMGLFPLPTPGGAADPTLNPSRVRFYSTGCDGVMSDDLTGGTWTGIGNPAGSKGYKYKNVGAPGTGAVKVIVFKEKVIKILAKDDGTVDGPVVGTLGVDLSVGADTYCAEFGGTGIKNLPGLVKRKEAAAPGSCPSPGVGPCGTTTTTTIPGAACGNGMVESPETCDDGNTDNADACPSDCIVDPCDPTVNPGGQLTVTMDNTQGNSFGVATVFIDYPEGMVLIPGSADDSQVQGAVIDRPTGGAPTCLVNDRDHGLQFGCLSFSGGFPDGLFFRVNFNDCQAPMTPNLGDFNCQVLEAADTLGTEVTANCTLGYTP